MTKVLIARRSNPQAEESIFRAGSRGLVEAKMRNHVSKPGLENSPWEDPESLGARFARFSRLFAPESSVK